MSVELGLEQGVHEDSDTLASVVVVSTACRPARQAMASALSSDTPWPAGLASVTHKAPWTKMAKPAPPSPFAGTDPSATSGCPPGGGR